MKFKAIFFLFNIIIVISLLFILFLPMILLDWQYTREFWSANWYLGALFFALLIGVNGYFLRLWPVYELLENGDWARLQKFLHAQIFERKRFRYQYIRLFIHNAIVRTSPDEIESLEQLLRDNAPGMHSRFALLLGIPLILRNDHVSMEAYYGEARNTLHHYPARRREHRELWLAWGYSFSLFLQKKTGESRPLLWGCVQSSRDPIVRLLSLYMLATMTPESERGDIRDAARGFAAKESRSKMAACIERNSDNLIILILHQLIVDAMSWLYEDDTQGAHKESAGD